MSQNNSDSDFSLIDKVDEFVSTDYVSDLKSGIFNLFVSLYQHLSLEIGSEKAMQYSTEYLKEIIDTFNKAIENKEQQTNI
jgi:hypothetical protein